jgi:predicted O-methyltransferase YrrM
MTTKKSLLKKSIESFKNDGFYVFMSKAINLILRVIEPWKLILYPWWSMQISKEAENKQTPESAVNFVFENIGGFLRPYQIKWEITELARMVEKSKSQIILEIGSFKGGTLFVFSRMAKNNALILSIDLPGGPFGGGYPSWKKYFFKKIASKNQKIELIRGNSHSLETLEYLKKILSGRKIDFLFIDGDHTYEGVKKDYDLYSNFVKDGGLIAFHDIVKHKDITNCNIYDFWNELKKVKKYKEIIYNPSQDWAGIGVIFK